MSCGLPPGSPMRTVHWKLTAKTGEMIVRRRWCLRARPSAGGEAGRP
ncbi:DUF58 domain-containing protein [Ruthenibacterium lactatiformans]